MLLCRNQMSGANQTLVFQQGLRKMQSSWPRNRKVLMHQSELNICTVFITAYTHRRSEHNSTPHSCSHIRRKLEEKAKLYEQMTKGDFLGWWSLNLPLPMSGCTTKCINVEFKSVLYRVRWRLFLVDFTQKIINKKRESLVCAFSVFFFQHLLT